MQPPVQEIGCGTLTLLLPPIEAAISVLLLAILTVTATFDWRHEGIPDMFVAIIAVLGVAQVLLLDLELLDAVAGAAISGLVMFGLLWMSAVRHHGLGAAMAHVAWGDVTLMSALGLLLGASYLPAFWLLAGVGHALVFVLTRRGRTALRNGEAVPMAPALCVAAFLINVLRQADGLAEIIPY